MTGFLNTGKQKLMALILMFAITGGCEDNENPFSYEELILPQLQSMNMPRPTDSWNYPVYPGMDEWAKFESSQEMVDACQVPEKRLKKMSTQAVIQALWEYPFFTEPLHRYLYQKDFESLFLQNNAYNTLIKRSDAGKSLLNRLGLVLVDSSSVPEVRNHYTMLELLISQTIFLTQLNYEEKKTVVEVAIKNDTPASLLREVTWLLIARTMLNAGYEPFIEAIKNNERIETFIKTSEIYFYTEEESDIFIQRIQYYSKNFIN